MDVDKLIRTTFAGVLMFVGVYQSYVHKTWWSEALFLILSILLALKYVAVDESSDVSEEIADNHKVRHANESKIKERKGLNDLG